MGGPFRILLLLAALLVPAQALAFGGEDAKDGLPWHHEDITERALAGDALYAGGAGFSPEAADSVAWHADYIDSYLYNPIFWAQGGLGRFRAAMVGAEELVKLHFDDTFSTTGIRSTWQRYAAGTLIGLYWASLRGARGDLAAGHHILGVSVHAVQDFYAHTNWADDPGRRCQTWLQTEAADRDAMTIYAGAYELPEAAAPHHHGAYSPVCSVLRGETMDDALAVMCAAYSPLQNTAVCEGYRVCLAGSPITVSAFGRPVANDVHLGERGIALDNAWMARIQAQNRGLVDASGTFLPGRDGMHFRPEQCLAIANVQNRPEMCTTDADQVFAGVKDLAIRATIEWTDYLEQAMTAMGPAQASFWARLKVEESRQDDREAMFETFSNLPYLFLSAGPYPIANPSVADRPIEATAEGWYLRLRISTLNVVGSGTDADIYAEVGGDGWVERHLLDRASESNPLLGYDDFEEGDDDAYVVGPFPDPPTRLALVNDDAGAGEVLDALWDGFRRSIAGAVDGVRQTLITLVAGKADYVGTTTGFLTARSLRPLLAKPFHDVPMRVDGRDQGIFRFTYRLRPMAYLLTAEEAAGGWQAFEVQARALQSIEESAFDRGTGGDEPFVLFLMSPLNGREDQAGSYLSAPLDDFQKGQVHYFPRTTGSSHVMKVPPEGGVVLSARIFESDSESQADREDLLRTFASGLEADERRAARSFADELGRALAPDWTVRNLEAFAFRRGPSPEAGPVLTANVVGTIEGGEKSRVFPLDLTRIRSLLGPGFDVGSWVADPREAELLEGKWYAENFECDEATPGQTIDIVAEGDALRATKTLGDACIETGAESWTGTYYPETATIEATLLLGAGGDAGSVVHGPGVPPAGPPLEGAWEVEWQGTTRGTLHGRINLAESDGVWSYEIWLAEPRPDSHPNNALEWGHEAVVTDTSVAFEVYSNYLCYPEEYCPTDQHWRSRLDAAGPGEMRGTWSAGGRSGTEIWRRAPAPVIRSVTISQVMPPAATEPDSAAPGARPLRVGIDPEGVFSRQLIYLDIRGDNLDGPHRVWMAPAPEIAPHRAANPGNPTGSYLCDTAGPGAAPGTVPEVVGPSFATCRIEGEVAGFRIPMPTNRGVAAGLYTLYFDGQPIEFIIDKGAASRPLRLEAKACDVLEEVGGPLPGLIFRRSKP